MSEIYSYKETFEQNNHREIERKFLPLDPEVLSIFRKEAKPIEQLYLSHPEEPFSLRLRESFREDGTLHYSATLKDRGEITKSGIDRLEIETEISAETYTYYQSYSHTSLRKLRAEPLEGIVIDWFEDGHVHVEAEHPSGLLPLTSEYQLDAQLFVDITGDHFADNEWRAYMEHRKTHGGKEAISITPDLDPAAVAQDIWKTAMTQPRGLVTIAGRSGSGKSTIISQLRDSLAQREVGSIVLSTDDYHRGKTWLEEYKGGTWTEWDAPIVYDLEAMTNDIKKLQKGESIATRQFDFTSEEPLCTGTTATAPVILIEGIYAGSSELDSLLPDKRYVIPTAFATCVGRRLLRDLKERPQFTDPEKGLRYVLEQAEPAYQAQET